MERLRIGIVGAVGHAEKFIRLINSYPESQVVVYCGREGVAAEIARRQRLPLEPDFDRMLWEYRLDGVVITVPNAEKKKLVIAAARAGVAIFLEKPLAVCREDALEMQRAVQEAGVKFYMSDPFVRPGILKFKEEIQNGKLGCIVGANIRHASDRALREAALPHIYCKSLSGGGIMADVGGHPLHILQYLFGQPETVCSSLYADTPMAIANGIEENASVLLHYRNGITVTLEASWVSGGDSSHTAVYGTDGWAEVVDCPGQEGSQQLTVHGSDGTAQVYTADDMPPMPTKHVHYFLKMILEDLPNDIVGHVPESCCGVSIDGAVQLACIIDAVYRSNNCGFVAVE